MRQGDIRGKTPGHFSYTAYMLHNIKKVSNTQSD